MKQIGESYAGSLNNQGIDRRTFLKIAGLAGGSLAIDGFLLKDAKAAEPLIEVEDPSYHKFYSARKGLYLQDSKWIEQTLPKLKWPQEGERVPELEVSIVSSQPVWIDMMRKVASDAKQLGIKYKLRTVSMTRYLGDWGPHYLKDIHLQVSVMRPERVDPSEWLTSRAHGLDRRNTGEWANKEYDKIVSLQTAESDPKKRLELVREAQKILAEDYYICQFGWGPSIVEAYNSDLWNGVVHSKGFGIGSLDLFWTYLEIQPKTPRKRFVAGVIDLINTTNIFDAGARYRALGKMIYDRLAYMDKDLNVIPWAAESWKKLDNRTWDVKLREGMKFHDGKPVTVDDLQFTFDFMLKYDRGTFYTVNQFLEKVEIVDRGNRLVRFRFKGPYGEFETNFLLLSIILPKHIFEGIMEKQNVGENPGQMEIPHPIGSGPFKFGPYRKDAQLLLIANKEHFHPPKIDEVLFVVIPSLDGIIGRLEAREIDIAEDIFLTPSQAKQLRKSKHLSIVRTPDMQWAFGAPKVSWLPWRDIEFRRAWHHSIDREFLAKVVWEGDGRVPKSNTFFVDEHPWHNPNLPPIPKYDLKLARQILKEAGYHWDKEGQLVYPAPTDKKFIERVTRVCKPGYHWGGLKMQPRS